MTTCRTCGGSADDGDPQGTICLGCHLYETACRCTTDSDTLDADSPMKWKLPAQLG